jgi:hypothetical protein
MRARQLQGNLPVGIQYINMKYELSSGTELEKENWFVGADWNFSGPHHVLGAYVHAGDSEGNARTNPGLGGGNGGIVAPNSLS